MPVDRAELALLLRRLTVELDAVGDRFATEHGLGRTDVRALVAIMDAARSGRAMTAGALGEAVELQLGVGDRAGRPAGAGRARAPVPRPRGPAARRPGGLGHRDGGRARASSVRCRATSLGAMAGYTDEELDVVRRFLVEMTVGDRAALPGGRGAHRLRAGQPVPVACWIGRPTVSAAWTSGASAR